jgi:circadian clock protein KaiC
MYVTLSESKPELEGVAKSHGWSLDPVALFEFTPTEENLRPEDQYSAFHPSEVEFQDTTQSILQTVECIAPQRLVFDSLSELRLLARDSLRYRRQILALKHYFSNRGCTVLLLDDKTSEGHDMQLHSIAHGVISLERLPREYGIGRRRLRGAKLRGSRFREGYRDYRIETGGVVVYPRLVASEHRLPAPEGVRTSGLAALDALWGGGAVWLQYHHCGSGWFRQVFSRAAIYSASGTRAKVRGGFSFRRNAADAIGAGGRIGFGPHSLARNRPSHD